MLESLIGFRAQMDVYIAAPLPYVYVGYVGEILDKQGFSDESL